MAQGGPVVPAESATRAKCSVASIALLERGYLPQQGTVLPAVLRVLEDAAPDSDAAGNELPDGSGPRSTTPSG